MQRFSFKERCSSPSPASTRWPRPWRVL